MCQVHRLSGLVATNPEGWNPHSAPREAICQICTGELQKSQEGDRRDKSWGCDEKAQQGFYCQKTKSGSLRLSENVSV